MSKWAGKYIIGLTGNIGTGKSVTRRMLEHLGAYGIDADALAHRAIAKGAPGYQPVLQTFGQWVSKEDGEIDRAKLGRIVFNDPAALEKLENIIHPFVLQAVDLIIRRAPQPVIVIEAIKLLESDLAKTCDSIWVTYAPVEIQIDRLMKNRQMSKEDAQQRIDAQLPQERKLAFANVIIKNISSFEDTWQQVAAFWQKISLAESSDATIRISRQQKAFNEENIEIIRGKPMHSIDIANLINQIHPGDNAVSSQDIMAAFGEKAFLMLNVDGKLRGIIGWQVENLIARTDDIFIHPDIPLQKALSLLLEEMERSSRKLQCEASLVFIPKTMPKQNEFWSQFGYEQRTIEDLETQAWQEAAEESGLVETIMYFKQLRQERVLRPL